ncbi:MAG: TetR family transcriptional regulator [Demequina sp.]|uniref:TetR family transcriptional regulator n=1 Tax=Demequina sp. TaxID=2050685 RepID=UPI003A8C7533
MSEGLREIKMRASRRAMEQVAVDIAYEEGVAAVTVDRVCAGAQVSRSTFFNYFPNLDHAIFGSPLEFDPTVTEPILEAHADDLVMASTLIVIAHVRGDKDDALARRRLALFAREPGTTNAVSWASDESRKRLVAVLEQWRERHPAATRLPADDPATEARIAVGLSVALGDEAMRSAREVDGELQLDVAVFEAVRSRMAAVAAMTATPAQTP